MELDISRPKLIFSTKIGPINVDGHVYKITDSDNTYFSNIFKYNVKSYYLKYKGVIMMTIKSVMYRLKYQWKYLELRSNVSEISNMISSNIVQDNVKLTQKIICTM